MLSGGCNKQKMVFRGFLLLKAHKVQCTYHLILLLKFIRYEQVKALRLTYNILIGHKDFKSILRNWSWIDLFHFRSKIAIVGSEQILVQCFLNDTELGACGEGIWTLLMKINGTKVLCIWSWMCILLNLIYVQNNIITDLMNATINDDGHSQSRLSDWCKSTNHCPARRKNELTYVINYVTTQKWS